MPIWLYDLPPRASALIMVLFIESLALAGLVLVRRFLIPRLHYHDGANDAVSGTVQAIGVFDLVVSAVLVLMLIGNILGTGRLYTLAYSRFAMVVYGWGALWGFLTAGSRVTAVGDFYPEVWDVVERAPNFLLPAALVYMVFQHRLDHSHTATSVPVVERTPQHS